MSQRSLQGSLDVILRDLDLSTTHTTSITKSVTHTPNTPSPPSTTPTRVHTSPQPLPSTEIHSSRRLPITSSERARPHLRRKILEYHSANKNNESGISFNPALLWRDADKVKRLPHPSTQPGCCRIMEALHDPISRHLGFDLFDPSSSTTDKLLLCSRDSPEACGKLGEELRPIAARAKGFTCSVDISRCPRQHA